MLPGRPIFNITSILASRKGSCMSTISKQKCSSLIKTLFFLGVIIFARPLALQEVRVLWSLSSFKIMYPQQLLEVMWNTVYNSKKKWAKGHNHKDKKATSISLCLPKQVCHFTVSLNIDLTEPQYEKWRLCLKEQLKDYHSHRKKKNIFTLKIMVQSMVHLTVLQQNYLSFQLWWTLL